VLAAGGLLGGDGPRPTARSMGESAYHRVRALGEGTFGVVYLATRKEDGREVAIKRTLPLEKQRGLHFSIIREVKFLQDLRCSNIVELVEVFLTGDSLHMVLEYCPFDLKDLIYDKKIFLQIGHFKSCLQMILQGVHHCHKNFVLHRDLKPANILIAADGQLRLADFGAAKTHASPRSMTTEIVTRAYRAPELLFGSTLYAGGVDLWAVGCIFAELLLRGPLFPGTSDIDQLARIFNVLGTPTESNWPMSQLLPSFVQFDPREPLQLESIFRPSDVGKSGVELLKRMLTLDPQKRISAEEALSHEYLVDSAPRPCLPSELPLPSQKS